MNPKIKASFWLFAACNSFILAALVCTGFQPWWWLTALAFFCIGLDMLRDALLHFKEALK